MEQDAEDRFAKPPPRERKDFSIPPWTSVIILGTGILIYYLISLNFHSLPTPLLRSDEADHPDSFIAERARDMLREFDKIGQKVVGSAQNEVQAIEFLEKEFERLLSDAKPAHKLEFSKTKHSGSYHYDHKPYGMIEWYKDIQNVQIRLSPAEGLAPATLLVNSHYDTVPVSPGMSDAGIMCMVMIETIRVLVKSPTAYRHNIVFLFNGAEEAGLKGAHGFITQHPWRHGITGLINLDSSGSGGKEILFQAGPDSPWLANLYANHAPHPYASAMGEELFQMNLIPSDTDFRVFRDYGGIKGLDLAYTYNGYIYHTKYDNFTNLPYGTFQHTGDNVLALARAMADSEEMDLDAEHTEDQSVFFDYFSWFTFAYTRLVSIIVNILVGLYMIKITVLSIRSMCKDCDYPFALGLKEFVYMLLIQAGSAIFGASLSLVLAVIYDAVGRSLSYYTNNWMVFGLYMLPLIFGLCIGPIVYFRVDKNKTMDRHYLLQMWMHANALLLTLILFLLTFFGIRSAFVILIPVLIYAFTMTDNLVFGFQKNPKLWLPITALGQLVPFVFFCYLSMIFFTTFIPMNARGGPGSNPELLICAFSFLLAWLMVGFTTPLIGFMKKDLWVWGGVGVLIVATIIMMATPLGFPYKAHVSPMRHWIFHSERTFYDLQGVKKSSDSGILLLPMDRHSSPEYMMDDMPAYAKAEPIEEHCEKELFCGMPFYTARMLQNSKYSYFVPTEPPYLNAELSFRRVVSQQPEGRFMFEISGTDTMGIFISPMPGVELVRWGFDEVVDTGLNFQGDRKTYFIMYSSGFPEPATFWIDLEVSSEFTGDKKVDIGVAMHFTHFDEERTEVVFGG